MAQNSGWVGGPNFIKIKKYKGGTNNSAPRKRRTLASIAYALGQAEKGRRLKRSK